MIYENLAHLLCNFDQRWLSHANLDTFASAISNRGVPLSHCWGFIDETHRPTINQKMLFSGQKRVHEIKFQIISAPNDLIVNLFLVDL